MPRGIKRTTIMSHGGRHDAKGVRGTHLRDTIPSATVLDAIPDALNTVGNVPETANPGKAGEVTRQDKPQQVRTQKAHRDAEGDLVLPGGNRSGPSTMRPQLDDVDVVPAVRTSSGQQVPEPVAVDPEPSNLPPPALEEEKVADGLSAPLPESKRKLKRAKNDRLLEWCAHLEINPEEYVDEGENVTGPLMRELLAERLNIEL